MKPSSAISRNLYLAQNEILYPPSKTKFLFLLSVGPWKPSHYYSFWKKIVYFWAFLSLWWNWAERTELLHILSASTYSCLALSTSLSQNDICIIIDESAFVGHNHPQSFSFHLVSLTGASSMGLEKRIIICIYHYGIGVFYCPQNQYRILSIFLINPCSFISSLPLKISLHLHLGKRSPWCFHLSPWAPPLLSLQSHCNIFWGN